MFLGTYTKMRVASVLLSVVMNYSYFLPVRRTLALFSAAAAAAAVLKRD